MGNIMLKTTQQVYNRQLGKKVMAELMGTPLIIYEICFTPQDSRI